MYRLLFCLSFGVLFVCSTLAASTPLQSFHVQEYLRHQWTDELLHFPIAYSGKAPRALTLTDAEGKPVPCQVSGLTRKDGKVTGTAWTVASLPPKGALTFNLLPGKSPATALRLRAAGQEYLLGNECLTLRLPRLAGMLRKPADLASLPAPLLAVSDKDGKNWLGVGAWVNDGAALQVKSATTTVLEEGPVRVTVRYRLVFTNGRSYQADITLGDRQDAALFTDETDIEAPKAAFRFSFQPGLGADRVYWRNNYFADPAKGMTPAPISFGKEQVICNLRPWSYWWLKDLSVSAGFYKDGSEPFVGVIALRPSRWSPYGWDGADRTQLPITARPGGQLDLSLPLLAWPRQQTDTAKMNAFELIAYQYSQEALAKLNGADSARSITPLHRELAITVGSASEHVNKDNSKAKLRRQLVKYSEFPLDEVKDYAFDFTPAHSERKHPFLLFTQADIDRARRQAKTNTIVKAEFDKTVKYIDSCGGDKLVTKIQQQPDGWQKFYQDNFIGNGLGYGQCATAYMCSDEKKYGLMLAAGVKGMARKNIQDVLDEPWRPCLGGFAHVYPGTWTNLLFAYDAIAGTDYLTAEEKQEIDASLVFGAHVIAHSDYWNTEHGLCSANPNMTALVRLPRGLMALYLDGHPESAGWLSVAQTEMQRELKEWIAPGGAWIECPGYQGASLDPIFPFMQALKTVKGINYFVDPQFKATMDYYGFLLTPPDRRFPPINPTNQPSPMVLPSIGDMFAGSTTVFPGWMAQGAANADPAFSSRQEFCWQAMLGPYGTMYTQGYLPALTDPELPAAPPAELSRAFPGFGSVLRTSWTDPKASYVAHRAGYFVHHYHNDYNEIVYYAKGAPLCLDFGNLYQPLERVEPWYHNIVTFDMDTSTRSGRWPMSGSTDADALEMRSLPRTIDYSAGRSNGSGGQRDNRYLLLVKSDDPLGANYLVMRDVTTDGQPKQEFFWNLWCLSKDPEIAGNVVHFPGQLGVDLDVHLLSPANPQFVKDRWDWKQYIGTWGNFSEEQYGIHVRKQGSAEDFFAVLYPRAAGQPAAQLTTLGDHLGVVVTHMEGRDVVLLSPGKTANTSVDDIRLTGEVAFVRRNTNGALRLAVIKGNSSAKIGEWSLSSDGPCAIEVNGTRVAVESSGAAHRVVIHLPHDFITGAVIVEGKLSMCKRENDLLTIDLPDGPHTFSIHGT